MYINYMQQVKSSCFNGQDPREDFYQCNTQEFNKLFGDNQKMHLCQDPSKVESLKLLKQNNDEMKYYLINYSPIVFINGYMYKGNYDNYHNLAQAICNSFEEPPENCSKKEFFQAFQGLQTYGLFKFVAISVGVTLTLIAILVVLFYYFYRKKINSTFKVELNKKIDEALNKYY